MNTYQLAKGLAMQKEATKDMVKGKPVENDCEYLSTMEYFEMLLESKKKRREHD